MNTLHVDAVTRKSVDDVRPPLDDLRTFTNSGGAGLQTDSPTDYVRSGQFQTETRADVVLNSHCGIDDVGTDHGAFPNAAHSRVLVNRI